MNMQSHISLAITALVVGLTFAIANEWGVPRSILDIPSYLIAIFFSGYVRLLFVVLFAALVSARILGVTDPTDSSIIIPICVALIGACLCWLLISHLGPSSGNNFYPE